MKLNLLIILCLFGCTNGRLKVLTDPVDDFVFSSNADALAYSIKFTSNDTVFLAINFPKRGKKYFSLIKKYQKQALDSFLYIFSLSTYDTTYIQQNLQDGLGYKLYLRQDTAVEWVYIYGEEGPKELYEFTKWLTNLKEQMKFYPYHGEVKFGNLKYIESPGIPPPSKGEK